jgi:PIN domain nuclease of toxin-antitoxin system
LTRELLLDTHIWLWSLLEPDRLTDPVRTALSEAKNRTWLSPISTWEFLLLVLKGRIAINVTPEQWLERAWRAAPMWQAPVTHEIAIASRRIKLPHKDPADRFLAATAAVLDLTFVTADRRLWEAPGVEIFAN